MESLDYRYYNICINSHSAILDQDGSVQVIVAHSDPGLPNWIETAGHTEGTMCWRWYRPDEEVPSELSARVVRFEELKGLADA